VGAASARENVTLATLGRYFRAGRLRHRDEERAVRVVFDEFEVLPPAPDAPMATFSGGNRQKAILAKWFATRPVVLLLDEPTHGVDVGAKQQILRHLRDTAASGTAVVITSVEADDLAQLCHRVLVFRHGEVVAELQGSELTAPRITEQAQLDQVA
jgi:ribose transport system ATP-binding protein